MVDLKWRDSVALPVAVFGAALGVASLFGEWSRVVLSGGETRPAWTFSTLGPFALVYVIALFALVVIVSVALFGRRRAGGK